MERVIIIDHETHTAFIEDIDEDVLEKEYGGEEEAYIKDNYELSDTWTWEYVTSIQYIPMDDPDPIEVEPTDWI